MEDETPFLQHMLYALVYVSLFIIFLGVVSISLESFFGIEVTEDKIPLGVIVTQYSLNNLLAVSMTGLFLVVLATYRLTHFVVYDSLTTPFRAALKKKRSNAFLAMFYTLVSCPWCFSVWSVLIVLGLLLYFGLTGFLFVFILAVSGIVALLILLTNLIKQSFNKGPDRPSEVKANAANTNLHARSEETERAKEPVRGFEHRDGDS